jgi:regulator of replication initiation timing
VIGLLLHTTNTIARSNLEYLDLYITQYIKNTNEFLKIHQSTITQAIVNYNKLKNSIPSLDLYGDLGAYDEIINNLKNNLQSINEFITQMIKAKEIFQQECDNILIKISQEPKIPTKHKIKKNFNFFDPDALINILQQNENLIKKIQDFFDVNNIRIAQYTTINDDGANKLSHYLDDIKNKKDQYRILNRPSTTLTGSNSLSPSKYSLSNRSSSLSDSFNIKK